MSYYFMVEEKRGSYKPIEIDKTSIYNIKKKEYVKKGAYGLKEIDLFTTLFRDETELRQTLLDEGLLSFENKDKPLSIRFYSKNVYSKVRHDFLYEKDLKYIQDPRNVWRFVMNRFNQEDYVFIEKLAAYFSHHHECANTATEVMHGALHTIHSGRKHPILERYDLNGDLFISRLIKLIIYKSYTDYSGCTVYKDEVIHRNLHAIIAFINNYYKEDVPKEEKPKTRVRTKEKDDGQLKWDF